MTAGTLRYDEPALVRRLSGLAPWARAVFAATCAERMLPAYRRVYERTGRGAPDRLAQALSELWRHLESVRQLESGQHAELERHLAEAQSLVPGEDDWVEDYAYAQHAAAAVAYAIRTRLTGEAQEAAWAARQVYEALDFRIVNREDVDLNMVDAEQAIIEDVLIQKELRRQQRDLGLLVREWGPEVVVRVRQRARQEAPSVFDL